MATVSLRLLGGFELEHEGAALEVTPRAQRLLAFVALTPRGAERSYTAFQLWPEHGEDRAKANLRSALWRLSKLPVELVVPTKSHLRLSPAVWVDVRHGLAGTGSDGVTGANLPFRLFDADLLPEWYDDWLLIERERLRQLRLGSLEEAALAALAGGHHTGAVQLALASLAVDPFRESAHRLVIEAHLASGNRLDARRHYQTYVQLFESGLGCPPSARLTALVEETATPAPPLLVAV